MFVFVFLIIFFSFCKCNYYNCCFYCFPSFAILFTLICKMFECSYKYKKTAWKFFLLPNSYVNFVIIFFRKMYVSFLESRRSDSRKRVLSSPLEYILVGVNLFMWVCKGERFLLVCCCCYIVLSSVLAVAWFV